MYAGAQSLLLRYPAQQGIELLPLMSIEGRADSVIMLPRNTANLFCRVSARRGQMQRIRPPILGTLTALDQTSFLKIVQQRNQLAWQDGQTTGELLLAESG